VITEQVRTDLERFLGSARWFGGKGRPFTLRELRRVGEVPGEGDFRVTVDLARVGYADAEGGEELYQVPLVFHEHPQERIEHAYLGYWDDPDLGQAHVYDALYDRHAMARWLHEFGRASTGAADPATPLLFHRLPGHDLDTSAQGALFSGEQSNSSVAFGEDSLMKVFRKVTPGVNPDVQVHEVLTRAGSEHVAALYGWIDMVDPEADAESGALVQLAMLQQFLRTASDGWELARASVRNLFAEADLHAHEVGGDFAGEASRLGVALAETHASLAEAFPVENRSTPQMAALSRRMHGRLDEAIAVVPGLAAYAEGLRAAFDAVAVLDGVEAQRIHGDLHLGQTLRTVKGWKLVDFEGEPAKPLAERLLPDPVWRDVAGMLRSFDYAAAAVERELGEHDPQVVEQLDYRAAEWARRNRGAFVTAYAGRELTRFEQVLLDAYEVDKAIYECVYEVRNRPSWLDIPLSAVARLAGQA
jgi:maltokinase